MSNRLHFFFKFDSGEVVTPEDTHKTSTVVSYQSCFHNVSLVCSARKEEKALFCFMKT
jgi:hypothetical protein